MQIEEIFRVLEDDRWSFGLLCARTHSIARRQVLLLIGALATLVLRLVGLAAKDNGWARHYRANAERGREVLSVLFPGREILGIEHLGSRPPELTSAANRLRDLVHAAAIAA